METGAKVATPPANPTTTQNTTLNVDVAVNVVHWIYSSVFKSGRRLILCYNFCPNALLRKLALRKSTQSHVTMKAATSTPQ